MEDNYYIKRFRKYVLYYVGAILIITIVFFIFNYSIVNIQTEDGSIVQFNNQDEGKNIKGNIGLNLLKKAEYQIVSKKDSRETRQVVSLGPLQLFHQSNLPLVNQKKLYKISSSQEGCIYGSRSEMLSGITYGFSCNDFQYIAYNNIGETIVDKVIYDPFKASFATNYKDGIVGIEFPSETDATKTFIKYMSSSENTSIDISRFKLSSKNTLLYVDDRYIYILDTYNKKLYTIKDLSENSIEERYLEFPRTLASNISLSFYNSTIYLYSPSTPRGDGSISDLTPGGSLYIYKNTSKPEKILNINDQKISPNFYGFSIFDNSNSIVGNFFSSGNANILSINGDSISLKNILYNAQNSIKYINKLYITTVDGSVYRYDKNLNVSFLVFKSNNTKIIDLTKITDKNIILSGYSINDDSNSKISFLLSDDNYKEGQRLEDFLPYRSNSTNIAPYKIDYYGNNIIASTKAPVSIRSDSDTDDNELNKLYIESVIRDNGIDLSKYRLSFIFNSPY